MKLKLDDYTIGKLRGKKIQVKIKSGNPDLVIGGAFVAGTGILIPCAESLLPKLISRVSLIDKDSNTSNLLTIN